MSKENESYKFWSLEIGFYPGILLGIRSYYEEDQVTHVLYMPLIDLALTLYKK